MESQWVPQEAARAMVGLGDSQWRSWRRRVKRSQREDEPPLEREVSGQSHKTEIDLPFWLLAFTQLLLADARQQTPRYSGPDELLDEDEEDEGWQNLCYREKFYALQRQNQIAEGQLLLATEVEQAVTSAAAGLAGVAARLCDACRGEYELGVQQVATRIEEVFGGGGDDCEAEEGAEGSGEDSATESASGGDRSGAGVCAGGAAPEDPEPPPVC